MIPTKETPTSLRRAGYNWTVWGHGGMLYVQFNSFIEAKECFDWFSQNNSVELWYESAEHEKRMDASIYFDENVAL